VKLIALLAVSLVAAAPQKLTPLDETGVQKLIAAQKGKAVLVNFWATWCEPCRAEMPQLVAMNSRLKGKPFQLLVISADEPEQAADAYKFVTSHSVPLPSYIKHAKSDDHFINAFDPKWSGAVPALFLYDRTGKRVKSWIGETEIAEVEAAVRKLVP
jgi:thiol-disulfide isomerase/thioredoxin